MKKYRLVEAKIPKLFPDEINIDYLYRYDVEYLETEFFGLIKRWKKDNSYYRLEQAKARIKFLKAEETWKVIDVE
jgi:hypothetical protein